MMARSRSPFNVVVSGTLRRGLRLPQRKPVPRPDALRLRALHPRDSGGQLGRQQTVVCRLRRQFADR
jgi:hypothetical protein